MAITRNSIEGHRNATLVAQKGAYAFERQLFVRSVAVQNKAYHQRDLNGVQGSGTTRGNVLAKAIRIGVKGLAPSLERGEGIKQQSPRPGKGRRRQTRSYPCQYHKNGWRGASPDAFPGAVGSLGLGQHLPRPRPCVCLCSFPPIKFCR